MVHGRPRDVAALPGVRDGSVHVQDPAQQWACSLLRRLGGEGARVLDACAAPGGKTRALLRPRRHAGLHVVAVERAEAKCDRLREAFAADERVLVRCGDAAEPAGWWDGEPFAAIIADVPCSATGIMRSRPEVKLHQNPESVAALQQTQLRILRALWPLLAEGGELLYTTCSLLARENDDVIDLFVRGSGVRASVVKPRPPPAEYSSDHCVGEHGVTLLPSQWHQGCFAALVRKEVPKQHLRLSVDGVDGAERRREAGGRAAAASPGATGRSGTKSQASGIAHVRIRRRVRLGRPSPF